MKVDSQEDENRWRESAGSASLRGHGHPYHCNVGCYYAGSTSVTEWFSWKSFSEEMGDANVDLNLVFRWDWAPAGEYYGLAAQQRNRSMMHQRKGQFHVHTIYVDNVDEPAIRAWLEPHWKRLQEMWMPISASLVQP